MDDASSWLDEPVYCATSAKCLIFGNAVAHGFIMIFAATEEFGRFCDDPTRIINSIEWHSCP